MLPSRSNSAAVPDPKMTLKKLQKKKLNKTRNMECSEPFEFNFDA